MRKKAELISNGLVQVPNISIEYRGFTIQPKRDFGSYPYQNVNVYRKGYVCVKDYTNPMAGATWSHTVTGAKIMIDCHIEAEGDGDKFWELMGQWEERDYIRKAESIIDDEIESVYNGLCNVPNIHIEYKGYHIRPKRDFAGVKIEQDGNTYNKAYVIVDDTGCAILPYSTIIDGITEAKVIIDCKVQSKDDNEKFMQLLEQMQGLDIYEEV